MAMPNLSWPQPLVWLRCLLLIGVSGIPCPVTVSADAGETLRATYASLEEQLRQNQFKRPLILHSAETPARLAGDTYALVDYPFGEVSSGLNNPVHWCDLMLLHVNTKYCHALEEPSGTTLTIYVGKKRPEKLANATRLEFNYRVVAASQDYIEIVLNAKDGPLTTSDYRVLLEAVALPLDKTFLHLTYSYTTNFVGRLAMQAYLGTIGSGKVGFTVLGRGGDGQPDYIAGVRGLIERNTMRYYLAIDAFLGAAHEATPAARLEKSLQSWFTAVEQYPRQLHEVDRREYLEMKRAEYARQQTVY